MVFISHVKQCTQTKQNTKRETADCTENSIDPLSSCCRHAIERTVKPILSLLIRFRSNLSTFQKKRRPWRKQGFWREAIQKANKKPPLSHDVAVGVLITTWSPAPTSVSSLSTCTPCAIFGDCSSNATKRLRVR